MKRNVIALCMAVMIVACSILIPETACAAEKISRVSCLVHHFHSIPGNCYTYSSHPYLMENGLQGPVYGTCQITQFCSCYYDECVVCGYIDYSHPQQIHVESVTHSACGL